jgi:hypothetical protein
MPGVHPAGIGRPAGATRQASLTSAAGDRSTRRRWGGGATRRGSALGSRPSGRTTSATRSRHGSSRPRFRCSRCVRVWERKRNSGRCEFVQSRGAVRCTGDRTLRERPELNYGLARERTGLLEIVQGNWSWHRRGARCTAHALTDETPAAAGCANEGSAVAADDDKLEASTRRRFMSRPPGFSRSAVRLAGVIVGGNVFVLIAVAAMTPSAVLRALLGAYVVGTVALVLWLWHGERTLSHRARHARSGATAPPVESHGTVVVQRRSRRADLLRSYMVEVDGVALETIRDGALTPPRIRSTGSG